MNRLTLGVKVVLKQCRPTLFFIHRRHFISFPSPIVQFSSASTTDRNALSYFEEMHQKGKASEKQELLEQIDEVETTKLTRLEELEICLAFIDRRTLEMCQQSVATYRNLISTHKNETSDNKFVFYLRTLFAMLEAYYQDGIARRESDQALLSRINSVLDQIPDISRTKRQSLIGAIFLADNHSLKFFDYLKTLGMSQLRSEHVDQICQIALASKRADILVPLIEMPDFLPNNSLKHLAKLCEHLALVYGKQRQLDRLQWLWCKILEMGRIRGADRLLFKACLHRIAHFHRVANKRLPEGWEEQLKKLDNRMISFKSAHLKQPTSDDTLHISKK